MDEVKNVSGHINQNGNPDGDRQGNQKNADTSGNAGPKHHDKKESESMPDEAAACQHDTNKEHLTADQQVTELTNQLIEIQDKYLRLYAEFDNFKKRNAKERVEMILTAGEGITRSLLPVIDDLERAIKAGEQLPDNQTGMEGLKLILNKFNGILSSFGLQNMELNDAVFNPDFHEAVSNVQVEDKTLKGKIVDVVEKGYLLNGRVIRYAKVVVGC